MNTVFLNNIIVDNGYFLFYFYRISYLITDEMHVPTCNMSRSATRMFLRCPLAMATPTLERRRSPREVLSTLVSLLLLLLLLRRLSRKFLIKRYNIANKPRRNYQNAITEHGLLYNSTYLYKIMFYEWRLLIFQPFVRLSILQISQMKRDYQ